MVHGLRLRDGRAEWYRNRYVRDPQVCAAKGWPPVPGPGEGSAVNTNVIAHAGKIFAIVEAGGLPRWRDGRRPPHVEAMLAGLRALDAPPPWVPAGGRGPA